ncbi:MAG TPA: tRNA (adenosine(37)-N6)-threonylcarbamoyltransferase complex dimerization subunit type 1 TsaB [Aggregatilineales bacterium]|nr:tRNA (adenosine(37)-N6)-threonylcarbamoyltransferase complex dimerization subunit type 1 TsaB [Anaerolineales bacterium]HRE47649.1 tRNA (adenosine(37)-N6)-threonylcarbamoyltransferase complex dimerization subunit type 1 TsaB [Aggregatilineales bacterium]
MLLAIDTATRLISLALYDGHDLHAERTWRTANQHSAELMPAIQHMLAAAGILPTTLTALAVSQGPGSFNGLRIGISTAKGLAMALRLPLIAIPTLEVVAAQHRPAPADPPYFGATAQAGRGRVCLAWYRWQHGQTGEGGRWAAEGSPHIVGWEALIAAANALGGALIGGEIDPAGRAALTAAGIPYVGAATMLRRAGYLAELAWARWQAGDFGPPESVTPIYLHQPGVPHP